MRPYLIFFVFVGIFYAVAAAAYGFGLLVQLILGS